MATLRGNVLDDGDASSPGGGGRLSSLKRQHSGPRAGKWEGEASGATMLNSVNCLAAGAGGNWLFAAGETVVRAWSRRAGMWVGGEELPGKGLGGVSSLCVLD